MCVFVMFRQEFVERGDQKRRMESLDFFCPLDMFYILLIWTWVGLRWCCRVDAYVSPRAPSHATSLPKHLEACAHPSLQSSDLPAILQETSRRALFWSPVIQSWIVILSSCMTRHMSFEWWWCFTRRCCQRKMRHAAPILRLVEEYLEVQNRG